MFDESEMLASCSRVTSHSKSWQQWTGYDLRYLPGFIWNRGAHQINNNSRVLRRQLSTATEHEHASTKHCYRACIIEYFSWVNVLTCLQSEVYKNNNVSSTLVPLPCYVTRFIVQWFSKQKETWLRYGSYFLCSNEPWRPWFQHVSSLA